MKEIIKRTLLTLAIVALSLLTVSTTVADPLPGRDLMKFSQKPMINTPIVSLDPNGVAQTTLYGGHDELSTAYGFSNAGTPPQDYTGRFMADDFADKLSSPVVHVKWWGSYLHAQGPQNPNMPVNRFLISFENDIPQSSTNPFSHPGDKRFNQVVTLAPTLTPGSGTYTEKLIRGPDPVVGESLYEYNAELHLGKDFPELKDTVYWLKIVAMVDSIPGVTFDPFNPQNSSFPVTQWGWHNRDYTVQNTLASPNVVGPPFPPGEAIAGTVGLNTPVWHFQDDAVTGDVRIQPGPMGFVMPNVQQRNYAETHYLDFADGPGPGPIAGTTHIGQFSKDLAFELYTVVPEPTSCLMLSVGLIGVLMHRRRSQSA